MASQTVVQIVSGNCLLHVRRQFITGANADFSSTEPLGTSVNDIWIKNTATIIQENAFENVCKLSTILFSLGVKGWAYVAFVIIDEMNLPQSYNVYS